MSGVDIATVQNARIGIVLFTALYVELVDMSCLKIGHARLLMCNRLRVLHIFYRVDIFGFDGAVVDP
jgi:hypothetical protein